MSERFPRRVLAAAFLASVVAFSLTVYAEQPGWKKGDVLRGKVTAVGDGDSLTLLVDKQEIKVRLEGIDAPELSQPFGKESKEILEFKALDKVANVFVAGKDQYGRCLGVLFVNDINVNQRLVMGGWAWHYKKFNDDRTLAALEIRARTFKSGLWAEADPMPPWEYKALPKDRDEDVGKAPLEKPFWLNLNSNVRHNSKCESFAKTKEGRYCTADEGKPCKKCGG